jgi:hypothetical protein
MLLYKVEKEDPWTQIMDEMTFDFDGIKKNIKRNHCFVSLQSLN